MQWTSVLITVLLSVLPWAGTLIWVLGRLITRVDSVEERVKEHTQHHRDHFHHAAQADIHQVSLSEKTLSVVFAKLEQQQASNHAENQRRMESMEGLIRQGRS